MIVEQKINPYCLNIGFTVRIQIHKPALSSLSGIQCAPNLSHTYHKCPLLLGSLEAAMTKFGSGINELELNGFLGLARCVQEQGLRGEGTNMHRYFTYPTRSFTF